MVIKRWSFQPLMKKLHRFAVVVVREKNRPFVADIGVIRNRGTSNSHGLPVGIYRENQWPNCCT